MCTRENVIKSFTGILKLNLFDEFVTGIFVQLARLQVGGFCCRQVFQCRSQLLSIGTTERLDRFTAVIEHKRGHGPNLRRCRCIRIVIDIHLAKRNRLQRISRSQFAIDRLNRSARTTPHGGIVHATLAIQLHKLFDRVQRRQVHHGPNSRRCCCCCRITSQSHGGLAHKPQWSVPQLQ
jgi:hypothetical protein